MNPHDHLFEVGGAKVSRLEDMRLITGAGRYAADWNLPGQLHAAFVRSDRPHARIVRIDTSAAKKEPGVAGVYTGEDAVKAGYVKPMSMLSFPGKNGVKGIIPDRPILCRDRVRYVGDLVAMVVADTALRAQDAAEKIEVEYEDLPFVISPEEALTPGAPLLHDNVPGNQPFIFEAGNAANADAAFKSAAHVTQLKIQITRVVPNPMETRACLAVYDAPKDHYTIHVCVQGVNMMRKQLAHYMALAEDKMTVIAKDVGGGFGQRSTGYPEYVAALLAAKTLGKPVKWVSSRSEGFLSDTHGRGNTVTAEIALDAKAKITALRLDWIADMGAYLTPAGPVSHIRNPSTCLNGVYDIPALYGQWRLAMTNTNPIAAYRGAGRPDIAYVIERLVSQAAAELKLDAAEIRRRNFIPPEAFPYKTATGSTYDNGDFPGVLKKALAIAEWDGYAARRDASAKNGKIRGRGIATVIENTATGAFPKDEILLEVETDGRVTAYSVAHSQGQGHETTFAMMVAKAMDIPAERVSVRQGLQEKQLTGNHTGGSRTMVGAGTVCHIAGVKLVEHGKRLAAEEMGLEPSQVDYAGGEFKSKVSDKKLSLAQLAQKKKVSVVGEGSFLATFPNGCHIAELEIDPQTGVTEVVKYVTVDDCGEVVNHKIVEGQMHGAVAQGYGQIFGENVVYDKDSGQLLTGSFSDYYMPRAGWMKEITMEEHFTASRVNPLNIKGMGESGCTASIPALSNAVMDALHTVGIRHLDMPFTPSRLWHTLTAARAK